MTLESILTLLVLFIVYGVVTAMSVKRGRLLFKIDMYQEFDGALDDLKELSDQPVEYRQGYIEALDNIGKRLDRL